VQVALPAIPEGQSEGMGVVPGERMEEGLMSQKTILLPSNCLGCAIRLVAFRDIREKDWSSLYIETLSDHVYQWIGSWRGRLR